MYPAAMTDDDPELDDPELVALQGLNGRLEVLYQHRDDGLGGPSLDTVIDALETEAARLMQARSDRMWLPFIVRYNAAVAEAHRLLGLPPPTAPEVERSLEAATGASREGLGVPPREGRET